MKHPLAEVLILLLVLTSPAFAGGSVPGDVAAPGSDGGALLALSATGSLLTLEPRIPFTEARLTVAGESDLLVRRRFEGGGTITWDLRDDAGNPLTDGVYTWELVLVDDLVEVSEGAEGRVPSLRRSGRFEIRGGQLLLPRAALTGRSEALLRESLGASSSEVSGPLAFTHNANVTIDGKLVVGADEAVPLDDIQIVADSRDGEDPAGIIFQNLDGAGVVDNDSQWIVQADMDNSRFQVRNGPVLGTQTRPLTLEEGAPDDAIYVRSTGEVGLGTATPAWRLHLADPFPQIRLEASGDGLFTQLEFVGGSTNRFAIEGNTEQNILEASGSAPEDSVVIDSSGQVGIGTDSPASRLHLFQSAGEPNIRLETAATAGVRFELKNSAGEWEFIAGPLGAFNFNRVGVAGNQFTFGTTGNLIIQGSLSQGSSRTMKHAITPTNGREVLQKLLGLPVAEWSYQSQSSRHFGPMAEDFRTTFGLGSDPTHLAPGDMAGVALAAIQGLDATMQGLITARDQRIAALEAELADLRALVKQLAEP